MMKTNCIAILVFLITYQFNAQNQPSAVRDFDTAEINTTLDVAAPGVLTNDTDIDGDALTIINFFVNGRVFASGETATFFEGSITVNADGSFVFIPRPNYTGFVPSIRYTVSDGSLIDTASLFLTVERITDLLKVTNISSCNQGFTVDDEYKVTYFVTLQNESTARDYHENNLIKNIDLTSDLNAIYGNGCVTNVDNVFISTSVVNDFIGDPYPREFNNDALNQGFVTATSSSVFNANSINNLTLYPRQSIDIQFCVTINPFCDGRPNPTPSGSGINFDYVANVTSSIGNDTNNLLLTDFHTTVAKVAAGFHRPEIRPQVNPDGSYDFVNTVIISNSEGQADANNINYNMGLGNFLSDGIRFDELTITQVSGPAVTINPNYNGDTDTFLLTPNNSLEEGKTIILEVFALTEPITTSNAVFFSQLSNSQTQGGLDGIDETTASARRNFSFVIWSDVLGNHLDRYYPVNSPTQIASTDLQCSCSTLEMEFISTSSSRSRKVITAVDETPDGILEHQEVTFQLTITNTSLILQLDNLQLQDNLNNLCAGNIISITETPTIINSTATTNPQLNTDFDGTSDTNIFDGNSGLLNADESITVEFSVLFNEDCINTNTASFSATNPSGITVTSSGSVNVIASTDSDSDGITNTIDIDDDNDTILDVDEYNGLNPLDDDDGDFIPNYRDTDFDADANNDGIVDRFDFDNDGVPNHLDLDSDNDGILDITEAGNAVNDRNSNGRTNNVVGRNGFDNTLENSDTTTTSINFTIPNTDNNGNANFIDIDADDDGIVDNIEAQNTQNYNAPSGVILSSGIDTAFPNGILPVDTENDTIFDYVDTNSDNDIRDDRIEGWDLDNDGIAETVLSNIDADNDGLDDAYDNNNTRVNPTNNQLPTDFPNVDNEENPERDWREIIAIFVIIDNSRVTEGQDLVFTITLVTKNDNSIVIQSASPITINVNTINGTTLTEAFNVATAPFDYNTLSSTLVIPPFTETIQFTVTSLEDNISELDELFTANGIITSNNTVNTEIAGIGTLLDNESLPSISMNNSIENEGVDLVHTITLSHPSSRPVALNVETTDNTAINPEDYTAVSENLTINGTVDPNNANTEASFAITTLIDNLNELDQETLTVVATVTSANIGAQDLSKTGTILDIDPFPIIGIEDATTVEGNNLIFSITLLNLDLEPMRNYLPITLNLQTIAETATALDDYEELQTNAIIAQNTSSITQSVTTINDRLNEETETVLLSVTPLANGANTTATGFIKDDDFPNLFSPNGDGKSDTFKISGIEDFPNFKLLIVDRWGNEVYNYSNNGNPNPVWWDGKRNGKPVPVGVYYFTIDFNDGITKPKTNFIQLIR